MTTRRRKRISPIRAWSNTHHATLIWGPDDVLSEVPQLPRAAADARADAQAKIERIVRDYGFAGYEDAFREAMVESACKHNDYEYLEGRKAEGVGKKHVIDALRDSLRKSSDLLKKGQIRNRLDVTLKEAKPSDFPLGGGFYEKPPRPEWLDTAQRTIDALRKVIDLAIARPGNLNKTGDTARRDDALAAAEPLYEFWTKTLERMGMSRSGEKLNRGGRFLHACLNLICGPVSESLVAKLIIRLKAR